MAKCSCCHQAFVSKEGEICPVCQVKMRRGGNSGGDGKIQPPSGNGRRSGGELPVDPSQQRGGGRGQLPVNQNTWQSGKQPPAVRSWNSANYQTVGSDSREAFRSKSGRTDYVTGVVQNYQTAPSNESAMQRWMRSFSTGAPYTKEPMRISFNVLDRAGLQDMNLGNVRSVNVQMYGTISAGDISNGNEVEVWGKMKSNQVLYANRVRNKRNGVETEITRAIPGSVVRFVTLGVLILIAFVIFSLATGFDIGGGSGAGAGVTGAIAGLFSSVVGILKLIALLVIFVVGLRLASRLRISMQAWLIICGVIALFLFPPLAVPMLMIGGIILLVKSVLR